MTISSEPNPDETDATPWALDLSTSQRGAVESLDDVHYDDTSQMSYLQEPHIPAIDSDCGGVTKKADREVGEDQK